MSQANEGTQHQPHWSWPVPVVCPVCRGKLTHDGDDGRCASCQEKFTFCGDFLDLIVGGRFDDPTDLAQMLYEEQSNADSTCSYLIPMFRKLWTQRTPRILSLGCGTGVDVDLLCEAGYDCIGIDCGNRSKVWPRRRQTERLLLANGQHLPFEDQIFDGIFCGCVFPHVGVVGDSFQVTAQYHADRLALAREMTRVLKPQGKIVVSSPNRLFPFDIFHGRTGGSYKPRPYWPGDPFLLSVSDYRSLFQQAGCARAMAQPVHGYWNFIRSKHSIKGLILGLPVRCLLWLVSRASLHILYGSPLNPWIIVLIEKGDMICS